MDTVTYDPCIIFSVRKDVSYGNYFAGMKVSNVESS